jgi:ribosomal subunit interface protein
MAPSFRVRQNGIFTDWHDATRSQTGGGKENGMRTIIQTKNIRLPQFLQRWLDRSLAKITQHHQSLIQLSARISKDGKNLFRVQLFAKSKGKQHVVEVRENQLFLALSEAVDRLQRQLRESKERTKTLVKRRKRALREGNVKFAWE